MFPMVKTAFGNESLTETLWLGQDLSWCQAGPSFGGVRHDAVHHQAKVKDIPALPTSQVYRKIQNAC